MADFHPANFGSTQPGKANLLAQGSLTDREKSRRIRERIALTIPVRVSGSDGSYVWSEKSRLRDATSFGARIALSRPTEPGRLLHVVGAIPQSMRCFDYTEDEYRVWSLVRSVRLLDRKSDQGALVEIGVAFVGKSAPASFEADPSRRYEIAKSEGGLWSVKEDANEALSEISVSDKRKETRHPAPLEVLIEAFEENGSLSPGEETVTENISPHGAAVFTTLNLSPGRFVRISSKQYPHSALGVVRNHRLGADGIARLHLEFVGGEWRL